METIVMPNGRIIDLNVHRLRLQLGAMKNLAPTRRQTCRPLTSPILAIPDDEAALVAALVIRLAARLGRSSDNLPRSVNAALMDLVSAGDPVARLLYAWIDCGSTDDDFPQPFRQPSDRCQRPVAGQSAFGMLIYRHGRWWRPGSQKLIEADQRRLDRLQTLLSEEINRGNQPGTQTSFEPLVWGGI
jgi:hypothetical protein